MASVNTMVRQLSGLLGTNDLSTWEHDFVDRIVELTDSGKNVSNLSGKQVETVLKIFNKNFEG